MDPFRQFFLESIQQTLSCEANEESLLQFVTPSLTLDEIRGSQMLLHLLMDRRGHVHVGGCDDLYALDRAGKLDSLLAA